MNENKKKNTPFNPLRSTRCFIPIPTEINSRKDIEPNTAIIYGALSRYYSLFVDDGEIFPPISLLIEDTGLCKRVIIRHIKILSDKMLLIVYRTRPANRYWFVPYDSDGYPIEDTEEYKVAKAIKEHSGGGTPNALAEWVANRPLDVDLYPDFYKWSKATIKAPVTSERLPTGNFSESRSYPPVTSERLPTGNFSILRSYPPVTSEKLPTGNFSESRSYPPVTSEKLPVGNLEKLPTGNFSDDYTIILKSIEKDVRRHYSEQNYPESNEVSKMERPSSSRLFLNFSFQVQDLVSKIHPDHQDKAADDITLLRAIDNHVENIGHSNVVDIIANANKKAAAGEFKNGSYIAYVMAGLKKSMSKFAQKVYSEQTTSPRTNNNAKTNTPVQVGECLPHWCDDTAFKSRVENDRLGIDVARNHYKNMREDEQQALYDEFASDAAYVSGKLKSARIQDKADFNAFASFLACRIGQ